MSAVGMSCMYFTELDTPFVQVEVSTSMACLVRAGAIFDGVLSFVKDAVVAYVAQGAAFGALARFACWFAAPACVCKGPADQWLGLADCDVDSVLDRVVVICVPEGARSTFGA